jgi:hypothetical protein
MSDEVKYPWQQSVVDAFLAPRDSLAMKINIAERIIAARLQDSTQTDLEERIALKDALNALKTLLAETGPRPSRPDDRKREEIA